tara:strand:- start:2354 stop:2470 length:117 start_codon:yes stop_codon:yes gene_type:complete
MKLTKQEKIQLKFLIETALKGFILIVSISILLILIFKN